MYRLLQLLYQYRALLLFLLLEFISFWMLSRSNPYYSAVYFRSANLLAGSIYQARTNLLQYLSLKKVNEDLALENAQLRTSIARMRMPVLVQEPPDSTRIPEVPLDYDYIAAKVINNTIRKQHNFITINKGTRHGVQPGMGVISGAGVVGKVLAASNNFATVTSVLNIDMLVSARLARTGTFCTVNWDGRDPLRADLLYVPRHIRVQEQDSVVTSGYSDVFPENILIGLVRTVSPEGDDTFYNIELELSNDFSRLRYVYLIRNPDSSEREQLESALEGREDE
jgi:rod shape-determining protein MreC